MTHRGQMELLAAQTADKADTPDVVRALGYQGQTLSLDGIGAVRRRRSHSRSVRRRSFPTRQPESPDLWLGRCSNVRLQMGSMTSRPCAPELQTGQGYLIEGPPMGKEIDNRRASYVESRKFSPNKLSGPRALLK